MSDEQVVEEQKEQNQENVETQNVDPKAYEQIKNDMFKFKRSFMETQKQLEEYQQKMAQLEEEKLQNGENYKELWERERQSKESLQQKLKSLSTNVLEDKKLEAIKSEARKAGLDPDWEDMLTAFDTSDVLVETTDSGQFIVNGADTWVEALRADKPKMFRMKTDPAINNKTGNFDNREKTYSKAEVLKLQKENPSKYEEIITKKRHLIR